MDLSLVMGRGATKRLGRGQVKFNPYIKAGRGGGEG